MSVDKEAPSQLEAAMKRIEEQKETPLESNSREKFTPRERRDLAALRRQRKARNKTARKSRRANR